MRRSLSRRRFISTAAAGAAALAVAGSRASTAATHRITRPRPLPDPSQSGIEHIVVMCMENRSFDHYLGWVPGADGRQAGLVYTDNAGVPHPTRRWTDWTGCGFNDPDHSYEGGRVQLAGGRCDGFRKGDNDDYALGYYTEADLPVYASMARNFTVCDRWFCSMLGPTYPNRLYTHSAATDRITNSMTMSELPTIWDRLHDRGVSAAYYFSDLPVLALYGEKYLDRARPLASFLADARAGTLPSYTYLDPSFLGADQGGSNDDHPHADIRRGQSLVGQVVQALTTSPLWEKTVLVVTYDEWGGFFDHVAPPVLPDLDPRHAQAGFRVPTFVVSPFSSPATVAGAVYDHTSILRMVEWRWSLPPLTPRDKAARNIAEVLDFRAPNARPPLVAQLSDPGPHICGVGGGMTASEPFWEELAASPVVSRWAAVL